MTIYNGELGKRFSPPLAVLTLRPQILRVISQKIEEKRWLLTSAFHFSTNVDIFSFGETGKRAKQLLLTR